MNVYARFAAIMSDELAPPLTSHLRVAMSGGADSTALLLLTARWIAQRRPDLHLSAGHVHHGLRGPEADANEAHCRSLTANVGVELETVRVDTQSRRLCERISLEMAAREDRLDAFHRWVHDEGVDYVVVAHTADDQLETVLDRLLRGTGLEGLAGMAWATSLRGDATPRLLRPLLDIGRDELAAWRRAQGVSSSPDSSNASRDHRRNRLRHDLIPLLQRDYNPRLRAAILSLAERAREASRARRRRTSELELGIRRGPGVHALFLPRQTRECLGDLAPEVVRELWREATGSLAGLRRDHVERGGQILLGDRTGQRYCLPRGWYIQRVGPWLYLSRSIVTVTAPAPLSLARSGEATWLPFVVRWTRGPVRRCTPPPDDAARWWQEFPDGREAILLRGATRGDRCLVRGKRRRVLEMLRQYGVPRNLRVAYPVLTRAGAVLAVPGITGDPWRCGADRQELESGSAVDSGLRVELSIRPGASPLAFFLAGHLGVREERFPGRGNPTPESAAGERHGFRPARQSHD